MPRGRRLSAFFTDADLSAASDARSASRLMTRAAGVPGISELLTGRDISAAEEHGFCAAHGMFLSAASGDGWLAVGDAALAFDPLSSQGLFNALYTGLAGAEVLHRHLHGDGAALEDYRSELKRIQDTYTAHRVTWYGMERRWPDALFWRRRHFQ
jgi:flavin-dependent dehydrogenase